MADQTHDDAEPHSSINPSGWDHETVMFPVSYSTGWEIPSLVSFSGPQMSRYLEDQSGLSDGFWGVQPSANYPQLGWTDGEPLGADDPFISYGMSDYGTSTFGAPSYPFQLGPVFSLRDTPLFFNVDPAASLLQPSPTFLDCTQPPAPASGILRSPSSLLVDGDYRWNPRVLTDGLLGHGLAHDTGDSGPTKPEFGASGHDESPKPSTSRPFPAITNPSMRRVDDDPSHDGVPHAAACGQQSTPLGRQQACSWRGALPSVNQHLASQHSMHPDASPHRITAGNCSSCRHPRCEDCPFATGPFRKTPSIRAARQHPSVSETHALDLPVRKTSSIRAAVRPASQAWLFKQALFQLAQIDKPLCLVIDGLDEADRPISLIKLLADLHATTVPIRMLLVSPNTHEISSGFQKVAKHFDTETIRIEGNPVDFRAYIDHELDLGGDASYRELVTTQLPDRARGNQADSASETHVLDLSVPPADSTPGDDRGDVGLDLGLAHALDAQTIFSWIACGIERTYNWACHRCDQESGWFQDAMLLTHV